MTADETLAAVENLRSKFKAELLDFEELDDQIHLMDVYITSLRILGVNPISAISMVAHWNMEAAAEFSQGPRQ